MVKGVSKQVLSARFPRLYHMAEQGSWPSIMAHGLLSTSALLDLYEVGGPLRESIESVHRPTSIKISNHALGNAVIRDQKPMSDGGLLRSLRDDLSPSDWYRLLNDKVFFWLTKDRLSRLMGARAYRDRRHTVIIMDTSKILDVYEDQILLSPINSGCTKPYPASRGLDTFLSLNEYPFEFWDRKRSRKDPIVELAVVGGIHDVMPFVVRVEEAGGGQSPVALFES